MKIATEQSMTEVLIKVAIEITRTAVLAVREKESLGKLEVLL